MALVVQKYGGTSVGSLAHIRKVARHVHETVQRGEQVIVTISAMGEQTDDLLDMAKELNPKPPRRELDMLVTAGERISAALLAIALDERKVQAVSLTGSQCGILTDETHGNARISKITGERIRDSLAQGKVVIVAGFQGVSPRTKEITTLGRGGSDLSAIAIAAAMQAKKCQLYKDVQGVFTADPRVVKSARVLSELSFQAMNALAWAGASVLHPRGAHLAAKFGIPFEIRSSLELNHPGTLIQGSHAMESPKIEALAHHTAMSLVETRTNAGKAPTLMALALDWLWQQGEAPVVSMQGADGNGGVVLTQVLKTGLVDDYEQMLSEAARAREAKIERLRRQDGLATISIVGQGFQQSPETILKVTEVVKAETQFIDARNTAITLCVREDAVKATLEALHQALLG
jgi:aspartate kinase